MHCPGSIRRVAATSWAGAVVVLAASSPLHSQEHDHPTPEGFAERQAQAAAAPLFAAEDPLVLTLRTDIDWLRDERSDEEETDGTVTFVGEDGQPSVLPVEVRTRGEFRRNKRNCNFPPLRLDFPKSEAGGTVFEGQDKLKLVTPCHDSRDSYQAYVYDEYLAYKVLELLTPVSFRVRLVEITYEDINDEYETRTKIGFLIEDEDQMAARNRGVLEEVDDRMNPGLTYAPYSVMTSLFQYMIGNTDWSAIDFHNVKLLHSEEGRFFTVPYDFDFSGVVDARYAAPDPSLPIRSVTERLFRGFCFPQVRDRAHWESYFNERRQAVADLYLGFELLEPDDREDALEYFEDFWEVLADERRYQREILENCRS